MGLIGLAVLFLSCATTLLLLAIFKWDWMSKYPILYLDRFQRWWGSEYDSNIRKKTIIKYAVLVAAGILFAVISVRNYIDVFKLQYSIRVAAGETVPLAGGELVFQCQIPEDSITIIRKNFETGRISNYVVKADTHYYGEALVAFTAVLTNTTQEPLSISENDIKMLGISTDVNRGGRIKGSWMADHKTDLEGNVNLAPGESALLYFWIVLNPDEQTYPYIFVVRDKRNSYKVNLDSLSSVSADKLAQMNLNDVLQETLENAQELAFDNAYYDGNLGYVTLKEIQFKDAIDVTSSSGSPLHIEADAGNVFMDLVLQIDSDELLRTGDIVIMELPVMVMADTRLCEIKVYAVISDQKEPIEEGQQYSSEVHYEMQVPRNAQSYKIITFFDSDAYVMDYQR